MKLRHELQRATSNHERVVEVRSRWALEGRLLGGGVHKDERRR